jgi:ribokinase
MSSAALRAFFVTMGSEGCLVCTKDTVTPISGVKVQAVDTTGAGDAFAAGVAYGLARGWEWEKIGRFGNVVGGLSTRALGAQSALPTAREIFAILKEPIE